MKTIRYEIRGFPAFVLRVVLGILSAAVTAAMILMALTIFGVCVVAAVLIVLAACIVSARQQRYT